MPAMVSRRENKIFLIFITSAILFLLSERGESAPPKATDTFKSPCPPILKPVFKLWSSPATWPNRNIPGIGTERFKDVIIPCNVAVLLDIPIITVGILNIKGLLSVRDNASLRNFYVRAMHILVEGKLSIGSFEKQFGQKIKFELIPSPGRQHLEFTSFQPADEGNPRILGHKAFAVIGGQVDLHGMPGGKNTPSWCQLAATAKAGSTVIVVDNPLAVQWPIGGLIAVATTDYEYFQSEQRTIKGVKLSGKNVIITLDQPLTYMHNGVNVSDGMGGWVDERGEVLLLTRNIVITGTDEPSPNHLYGGHFIIFQTPDPPQYIEGVEFFKMGQQGCLGRYSQHFHVVGSSPRSISVKNSIHQSKQRCLVVHATHSITVKENVAFNNTGHCFSLEEGGEQNNLFHSNVAITTSPVQRKIPGESDNTPALFWISSPSNTHINNRAVGSLDSGFWWDTRKTVRGMSLNIPSLQSRTPNSTPIKLFKGNVAHSCHNVGMKTYPDFYKSPPPTSTNPGSALQDVLVYKHSNRGLFIHLTQQVNISGTFADNGVSVLLLETRGVHIYNSRFVGLTTNYGNPDDCYKVDRRGYYRSCMPISGCQMPLPAGTPGRTHSGFLTDPIHGIQISQDRRITGHTFPNSLSNIRFSLFNYTCSKLGTSAAIFPVSTTFLGSSFNPQFNMKGLKFDTNSLPIFFSPQIAYYQQMNISTDTGEVSQYTVMRDLDGSITGKPGVLVSNNPNLIPAKNCTFLPKLNAYGCVGTCYRSIKIQYGEPGFQKSNKPTNKRGDFSALKVTRASDGKTVIIDGNLNDIKSTGTFPFRVYFLILIAGETYNIEVIPPKSNPSFYPTSIDMGFHDGIATCDKVFKLRFRPPSTTNLQWVVGASRSSSVLGLCNGATPLPANTTMVQTTYTCVNKRSFFELLLPVYLDGPLTIQAKSGIQSCQSTGSCTILANGQSGWLWDASGTEHSSTFQNPKIPPAGFNKNGVAIFGANNVNRGLGTFMPRPSATRITYYFLKSFSLKDTACFSSLTIQLFLEDGIVLYLNGKEVLRSNMPTGTINSKTFALARKPAWMIWQNFTAPIPGPRNSYGLWEGTNTVAAEVHVFSAGAKRALFDIRLVGIRKSTCTGAAKRI